MRWCVATSTLVVCVSFATEEPAGSSGIEGVATASPIHGGPSRLGVDDSAPMKNTMFDVATDKGVVSSFATDDSGHFRVALAPGRYSIKMHEVRKIGRCAVLDVEVAAGELKKLHIECDTGIR